MRHVDFFALPRAVQERFLASTAAASPPLPLAYRSTGTRPPYGWLASALVALVALVYVLWLGLGDATSPLALAPSFMMAVYGVGIFWLSLSILEALGTTAQAAMVPFRRGIYLFPGGVVEARSGRLAVIPITELTRSELTMGATRVRLKFKGGQSYELELVDRNQAPALLESLPVHQQALAAAVAAQSQHDVALLDPLVDTGIHSPLMPTEKLARRVPALARHALWIALLPAAGLAWPTWNLRNDASEKRLFSAAMAANTPPAYLAYLAAGGVRSEVRGVLLPRAELAVAIRTGSTEAVAQVVVAHSASPVRPELEMALREMLLTELEAAKKAGSATAIRALGERMVRRDLVEGELAVALHDVYVRALDRYKQVAPPKNPELVPFMKRLLNHAERNGPRVEVRFRRALRPTVEATDDAVKHNPYYNGPQFQPSQYFSADRAAPREQQAFTRLKARFAKLFPSDIIELTPGPAIEDPTATYPTVTVPTVFVSHETLMGGTFAVRSPPGVYAGVGVVFEVSFRLPNKPSTLDFQISLWQTPDLNKVRDDRIPPEQVYEGLAATSFERFTSKLIGSWFVAE